MNVSRSGRIRKKSKFLTDSEFHTPKDSVIYGLSSLTTKGSLVKSVEPLDKPLVVEKGVLLQEGEFSYVWPVHYKKVHYI